MRRILVLTGVLGGGTALVFALAAITATLFPQGALVGGSWNGLMRGGLIVDDLMIEPPAKQAPIPPGAGDVVLP